VKGGGQRVKEGRVQGRVGKWRTAGRRQEGERG